MIYGAGIGACALVGLVPAPALIRRYGALGTLAMAHALLVVGMGGVAAASLLVPQPDAEHQ